MEETLVLTFAVLWFSFKPTLNTWSYSPQYEVVRLESRIKWITELRNNGPVVIDPAGPVFSPRILASPTCLVPVCAGFKVGMGQTETPDSRLGRREQLWTRDQLNPEEGQVPLTISTLIAPVSLTRQSEPLSRAELDLLWSWLSISLSSVSTLKKVKSSSR